MVEVRTRRERRSDKKQSFTLVVLLLAVAIVCFASGFMVGRNTAPKEAAPLVASTPRKPIVKAPEAAPEKSASENLTFYESLPKGDQPPLGSGINLRKQEPVATESTSPEPATKAEPKQPIPEKVFETAKVEQEKPAPQPSTVPKKEDPSAKYVLQVASYPQPVEAGKLVGSLTKGGYNVYMQQADLGDKGVWYRVFVGPVVGKTEASELQAKIEKEFKVKPLLRKQ